MLSEGVDYHTSGGYLERIDQDLNDTTLSAGTLFRWIPTGKAPPTPLDAPSDDANLERRKSYTGSTYFNSPGHFNGNSWDPYTSAGTDTQNALWAVDSWGGTRWHGSPTEPTPPPWVARQQTPQIDANTSANSERRSQGSAFASSSPFDWENDPFTANSNRALSLDPTTTMLDSASLFSPDLSSPFDFGHVAVDDPLFQESHATSSSAPFSRLRCQNSCSTHHRCLDIAQEKHLRSIAMPEHQECLPTVAANDPKPLTLSPPLSPSVPLQQQRRQSTRSKRKRSTNPDTEELVERAKSPVSNLPLSPPNSTQKDGHNVCEKRYRNKLNDRMALLRDCVPSFRSAAELQELPTKAEGTEEDDAGDGVDEPPLVKRKSNKGLILSRAIEYITHLEKTNSRLESEDLLLRAKVGVFEKLAGVGKLVKVDRIWT